jgi:transposase-like protein
VLATASGTTSGTTSLDHLPEDQAAALLLALQPGVTYRDVAARLGVEPAVILRWLRDGLRSVGGPMRTPPPPMAPRR